MAQALHRFDASGVVTSVAATDVDRRYHDAIELARDELTGGRYIDGDLATAAVDEHPGAQAALDVLNNALAGRPLAAVQEGRGDA
ncbi:hypothetical protein PAI11_37320 [Patulibacter medicamentivorans]|uniref:Uncharacterized protein n=1 Tax=Patulibacter medicamentivorans TaxID=1097667 RepID=H0EA58_9ACTN|nr:hypothetical protein PAI11_37320 [Patulibacter medicamentivorans]